MKTINFKQLSVYQDITKESTTIMDVRKDFSNLLYTKVSGIEAHALAWKIYESDGEIEFTEREETLVMEIASAFCFPLIIDSIKDNLKDNNHGSKENNND